MISSSKLGSKALMGILINIRNKADINFSNISTEDIQNMFYEAKT